MLVNNATDGLEGGLSLGDAAERERRKQQWKKLVSKTAAAWKAKFACGGGAGRAAAGRGRQPPNLFDPQGQVRCLHLLSPHSCSESMHVVLLTCLLIMRR